MRVLVLGGSNFIGRTIADHLLDGHEVTTLNRGSRPVPDSRLVRLVADRTDADQVRAALAGADSFDAVVDVSGTEAAHVRGLLDGWGPAVPSRYVQISSAAVYSPHGPRPMVEDGPVNGNPVWGGYGEEKAICEQLLRDQGLPELTALRPPYVYGPGNNEDREQWLWARMAAGRPIFVPGDGQARIQFCHVAFLADLVVAAIDGRIEPMTYNVGEERAYTFDEYLDVLASVSGFSPNIVHAGDTGVEARSYFPFRDMDVVLDMARLRRSGYEPCPALADGLAGTWGWFFRNGLPPDSPTEQERQWREHPPGGGRPKSSRRG